LNISGKHNLINNSYTSNTIPSTKNIFERLYKESEIKTRRRENLVRSNSQNLPRHLRNYSKISSKSQGQFDTMKIEDKLMQKHLSSMLKIEQMRKEKETESTRQYRNRPKLSSRTIEITKDSRSLYDRQKDLTRKKKINDEINRKTMEDNEMKEFTGVPKINQRSIEMRSSNISQLNKPVRQYHRLLQAHRHKSSSKRSSYDGKPPLQHKFNSRPSAKTSRRGPEQLRIFNPIEPYRDTTPKSVIEPPLSS
jgi:hypothetical protein